jgi:Predicted membrane protein (DUF2142)
MNHEMRDSIGAPSGKSDSNRWKPFWISFLLLFGMMLSWALASPLMSSPDEPAHTIRAAAVVRGDFTGSLSEEVPGTSEVFVPDYISHASDYTCYARVSSTVANCAITPSENPDALVKAFTTATLNTPVFYAIAGLPTLFLDGQIAMYAMRGMVALMCSILLAFVFMAVAQLQRNSWALIATAAAVTPMVLFLSGTINPNSVEVCGAAATLALLVLIFRTDSPGYLLWERIGLLSFSVFLLVNTRSLSLLWLLLAFVSAMILAKFEVVKTVFSRPIAWVGTGIMGAAVGLALWWFLTPTGLTQQSQDLAVGLGTPWRTAFLAMLNATFDYAASWVGVFGWLDTPAPGLTMIVWVAALVSLIVASVVLSSRNARFALILLAGTLLFLPPIVQASLVADWGYVWQGRYDLAVLVCLVIVAGISLDERFSLQWKWPASPLLPSALVLLGVAQLAAFVWALKRYTVGLATYDSWIDMIFRPEWQPPVGWIPLTVVFACFLAVGVIAIVRSLRPMRLEPLLSLPGATPETGHVEDQTSGR